MKRYFLTGCTGWVGSALVAEILRRNDTERVTMLTRNAQRNWHFYADPRVHLYEGDVTGTHLPSATQYTDVIHGASEDYYTIVEGTQRILEWMSDSARLLLISSGAADLADTQYGRAKRMSEWLLHRKTGKIARIYALIGEGTPIQFAAGLFAYQAANDSCVSVCGGEQARRSYLHLEDCARWLLEVLDNGVPLQPYDIGGDAAVSIADLADIVGDVFGVPVKHLPPKYPERDYLPDLSAINRLGCKQTISLDKALERIRDKTRIHHSDLEPAKAS